MRRTLAALLFTLGLSACGGEEEAAPTPDDGTHSAMFACTDYLPLCEQVEGRLCGPEGFGRPCCSPEGDQQTCICQPSGYWSCPGPM
ncbi:hypothetical protein [Pyxidicoccus sp. MSG2]|uniref:hypothetical protein n=1 Tax=Pyxidicoccus sp. MSG2 TaxID=2996790 RepID=UPI0022720850|nr:hypothetical protein [Pyxidicoccus sp. MSG2]MCY1021745.1 hypothetical protein [Pyxidicoccus sp. MSG2]